MSGTDRIDLVIFDCDGVLVDSERLTVGVEARVLTEMAGRSGSRRWSNGLWGVPTHTCSTRLRCISAGEAADEFDRVSTDEIVAAFREHLEPIDGVELLIEQLHSAGRLTCVASIGSHK